ncbi:GNAT family N-acetyltransferase [Paenibacillus sp. Marseille-Q4541]|uniref:GNAT family N-acetyltransferase n=1 Tax=Paenibacillus sp. Marseille-Q4541 TaxID=2831522 RepID=UPI001BAB469A
MVNVKLVPHSFSYAENIFNKVSVPEVKDALGVNDKTVDDTLRYIKWILEDEQIGNQLSRVILNEADELIGITTLMFIDNHQKKCHMGTWVAHEYWGIGYNEASKFEILKIAFIELGLNYVFAGARKTNIRSQKSQEKLPYIRLNVENEFPNELIFLENKEKQECVLHVFYKEDFLNYLHQSKASNK